MPRQDRVPPDFFLEYRLRQVVGLVEDSAPLIDTLYSIFLLRAPVSDEMKAILEKSTGDGDGGRPFLRSCDDS